MQVHFYACRFQIKFKSILCHTKEVPGITVNRELKQTDAAAVNRQISIQIQSDGCQGPTEFTWP